MKISELSAPQRKKLDTKIWLRAASEINLLRREQYNLKVELSELRNRVEDLELYSKKLLKAMVRIDKQK